MAKKTHSLPTSKRRTLKPSQFGLPGSRRYPVDTKPRARNAKARAAQQVKAGNLSKSSQAKINAKANKRLKRSR